MTGPAGRAATLGAAAALALLGWQAGPAGAAETEQVQAVLEFFVNTVDEGTAIVVFEGAEALISNDDLAKAGIRVTGGEREDIRGKSFVKLSTLAPGVAFAYDADALALRLTVDPHLLAETELNLQPGGKPANIIYAPSPSAFLNYAVNSDGSSTASLFTEQGASIGTTFFDNTINLSTSGPATRGTTSLSLDDRDDLTRMTLGDIAASGGTLGGAVSMAGIGYSKLFAINPYFVPFPTQRFAGIVNTPSTADIYVNGALVRTVELPPGEFNLQNIPGINGAGVTRVVIRNAFGEQQELSASFFQSSQVLRQGLSQYSYNLGFTRNLDTVSSLGSYELPAISATHAYGLTDWVSPGGFVQADPRLVAAGPQVTFALPVGQIGLFGAGSSGMAPFGWSSALQYSYQNPLVGFGANATYTSGRYATLSLTPAQDRQRWQASVFFNAQFGDWTGIIELSPSRYRDAGRSDQESASLTNRLTDRLSVTFTVGQSRTEHTGADTSILLGLTLTFGDASVATASEGHSREGWQSTAQVSKSLPIGPGYGYLAQVQTGKNAADAADLQYQTSFGTYEVDANRNSDIDTARLSASGAVAVIGGDLKFTTALRDAYALIRIPGAAGVTGYLSNQEIGRTDGNGDLFIPNLISYYGNRVEINDQEVPVDYGIGATELIVAPPYRGGSIVEFPIHRFQAFLGTLLVTSDGGTVIPAYGDLTLDAEGASFTSPVGEHGEFYFENLPKGNFPARVTYRRGECRFVLTVPEATDRYVRLGQLTCANR